VLLARNLGDTSAIVTGRLVFNRADGSVDRIALPQKMLEAGETALIDARTAWALCRSRPVMKASAWSSSTRRRRGRSSCRRAW